MATMSFVRISSGRGQLLTARSLAGSSRAFSSAVAARPRTGTPLVRSSRPTPLYAGLAPGGASRSLSLWPFSSSSPSPQETVAEGSSATTKGGSATTTAPSPDAVAAGQAPVQDALVPETGAGIVTPESAQHAMAAASEHVATLESLGKLSSWPNVHYAQEMLDWLVESTGLPWWATIALVTITIRIAVFPVVVKGQTNAIRLGNIQPEMNRHMKNLQAAKASGDMRVMTESTQAVQKLMKDNDCHPIKSLITPLVQAPLFMTLFFALKGLAGAGLESMKTGGLLWFTDISVADPTTVLPIVAAGLTLAVLETGAEMGAAAGAKTQQQRYMRNGLRIVCVAIVPFTWNLPAAVFCYWATNNVFSLLQLLFLQQAGVRRMLKLPKKVDRSGDDENDPLKPKPPSMLTKLKSRVSPPPTSFSSSSSSADSAAARPSAESVRRPAPLSASAMAASTRLRAADKDAELSRERALRRLMEGGQEKAAATEAASVAAAAATAASPAATPAAAVAEQEVADPYEVTLEEQLERERARKSEEKRQRVMSARQRRQKKT